MGNTHAVERKATIKVPAITVYQRVVAVFVNMDEMIGNDLEKSLDRLKTVRE